jgi:hypothetical protein
LKKVNKRILQLAVPSIISNITVPLLGLVDVAIVGHIGDAAYIGAIAVGSMLFNVIYWLFGFLRMGTSGMTSQALGRRDLAEVLRLLVRSLSIGVGIGVLFFVLQKWLIGCGLWAMSPEADVVELARRYCYVCIWGAPAVLGLYGFTGITVSSCQFHDIRFRGIAHSPQPISHFWRTKNSTPIPTPILRERTRSLSTSAKSLLPKACEVIPLVPILRNPKSQ